MKKNAFLYSFILASLLTCLYTKAFAQITYSYAMDSPSFIIFYQDVSKYEVMDESYLTLTYNYSFANYQGDTTLSGKDLMCLQIGKKYSKFYSENLNRLDSTCTELAKKTMQQFPLADDSRQGYEIYCDLKAKKMTVTNRLPYSHKVYEYTEPVPQISWSLSDGTRTVLGYECHKATAHLFGRDYIAWYTNDIPVNAGPWKFSGLPGAILEVYDTEGEFRFECVGVSQNRKAIVRYDWKYTDMGKEKWLDFKKNMYDNAGKFVKSTGEHVLVRDNSERGFSPISEEWKAYYNPIEK
ncbi:MAG: GLPGLI family protein [Bacteroidales bacterium]|nr:GLPGLI family protein [Bacteroidales bacterium]MCI2121457.1 GLPGLI family protein [Bacteroidales bacterium]MCI2145881.1 GLPGLI family protein [Bacteroidales bacterium]